MIRKEEGWIDIRLPVAWNKEPLAPQVPIVCCLLASVQRELCFVDVRLLYTRMTRSYVSAIEIEDLPA
jgi:hypothetical protein